MDIIKKFYVAKELKFKDLAKEIPSNKGAYYLKVLCDKDYLEKKGEKYVLSEKGEKYLTYLEKDKNDLIKQPIQNILLFPKKGSKYLFQRRIRRPFLGNFGPIGTKVKIGDSLFENAKESLKRDTGLEGNLEYKGILEVMVFKQKKLFLHYIFHIFIVKNLNGEVIEETSKGINDWTTEKDYYQNKKIITGMKEHFKIVNSKGFKYIELKQKMDKKGNFIDCKKIREI